MDVPGALTHPRQITTEEVSFDQGGHAVPAHLARPRRDHPDRPGLLVVHEAFGLNDHVRDLADRFAGAGFVALAPDLYSRTGPPDPADRSSLMEALLGLPDAQAMADLEAGAAFLRGLPGANGRVGAIGFCSGGRQVLLLACTTTAADAAVDCWGGFIDRAGPDDVTTAARPVPPLDVVGGLACPLYVVGGAEDANPSPALLDELRARLRGAGGQAAVEVFEGAGHAFLADYRETYREGPAHDLWPKVVAFLHGALDGAGTAQGLPG